MFNLKYHLSCIQSIHSKQNRKWDKGVPYWIHPLWCATMVLSEPIFDEETRHKYALALLYHDVVEITGNAWSVPAEVIHLVEDMTFKGFDEEMLLLMSKSDEVILLKLYDKTSNLLDGHWMTKGRHDEYCLHTLRLADHVEEVYGKLQIVDMARMLVGRRDDGRDN